MDLSWDVPLSGSANQFFTLPTNSVPVDPYGLSWYRWWVQTVGANNGLSAATFVGDEYYAGNESAMYTNARLAGSAVSRRAPTDAAEQ